MFHGVGFDIQAVRLEEKNTREFLLNIIAEQKRIGDILVARSSITSSQARKLFREASTKNAVQAKSAGLVRDIRDVQIPAGADVVSLVL
jgi:hypothetical protein